jgi:hypothetical protein
MAAKRILCVTEAENNRTLRVKPTDLFGRVEAGNGSGYNLEGFTR